MCRVGWQSIRLTRGRRMMWVHTLPWKESRHRACSGGCPWQSHTVLVPVFAYVCWKVIVNCQVSTFFFYIFLQCSFNPSRVQNPFFFSPSSCLLLVTPNSSLMTFFVSGNCTLFASQQSPWETWSNVSSGSGAGHWKAQAWILSRCSHCAAKFKDTDPVGTGQVAGQVAGLRAA